MPQADRSSCSLESQMLENSGQHTKDHSCGSCRRKNHTLLFSWVPPGLLHAICWPGGVNNYAATMFDGITIKISQSNK